MPTAPALSLTSDQARRLLDHFSQEEHCLNQMGSALEKLHLTLVSGRWADLPGLLEEQDPTRQEWQHLVRARQQLLNDFGKNNPRIPLPTTLAAWSFPHALAGPWRQLRLRLQEQAKQLDRLNRTIAFVVQHQSEFMQDLLATLTAQPAESLRYGPQGQRTAGTRGPILQAQG